MKNYAEHRAEQQATFWSSLDALLSEHIPDPPTPCAALNTVPPPSSKLDTITVFADRLTSQPLLVSYRIANAIEKDKLSRFLRESFKNLDFMQPGMDDKHDPNLRLTRAFLKAELALPNAKLPHLFAQTNSLLFPDTHRFPSITVKFMAAGVHCGLLSGRNLGQHLEHLGYSAEEITAEMTEGGLHTDENCVFSVQFTEPMA